MSAYDAAKGWGSFQAFDLTRTGNRVAFAVKYGNTTYLETYQLGGPPPNDQLTEICVSPLGDGTSKVRWSPDGTKITWADAQGVWTGVAPTRGAGGACNIANRTLIAAGGKDPDFGKADVPSPPPPPPGPDTGGNQNPDTGGGQTPDADNPGQRDTQHDTVAPSLAAFKAAGGKLGKSYVITFTPSESGKATLQLVQGKTLVGAATKNVTAGAKVKLSAKFTKKLKTSKKVNLTVRLVVTDAAGNQATKTAKVTLKR